MKNLSSSTLTCSGVFLLCVLCAGCAKKEASGSCFVSRMSDGSRACMDYSTDKDVELFRSGCEPAMRGIWSNGKCDTEESLGGCDLGTTKIWLFEAGDYESRDDVVEFCESKDAPYLEP